MITYCNKLTGTIFPLYINVVLQLLMLMFCCSVSCGAYVIKYILARDGDHMANHFTPVSLRIIVTSFFSLSEYWQIK
jgi:hypothetical protein